MSAANDLRIVEMLAGATFAPGAKLVLPSGMELDSSTANTVVNPDGLPERKPLPHGQNTPIFDDVTERFARAASPDVPEWPEPDTEEVADSTVEFARVKPAGVWRRFVRRLRLVRWSVSRVAAVCRRVRCWVLSVRLPCGR